MLTLVALLAAGLPSPAAVPHGSVPRGSVRVDTLWSQALGTRKQVVVYLPPSYATDSTRRFPVAYYLHGRGGDEWDWVHAGRLDVVMDSLVAAGSPEMIVVMPDGDEGFYTTWNALGGYPACVAHPPEREPAASYCVPWPRYDDYVARDLVAHVDSTFRTMSDRRHRGIAGLSMGGYGAVSLALEYPDVWSAAASHSGPLSPLLVARDGAGRARYAKSLAELEAAYAWSADVWPLRLRVFGRDTAGWWARDPARRAGLLLREHGAPAPALYIDVGRGDRFLAQNRAFHDALTAMGVAHRYAEWPGAHDWHYWRAHVGESLAWLAARIE